VKNVARESSCVYSSHGLPPQPRSSLRPGLAGPAVGTTLGLLLRLCGGFSACAVACLPV